MDCTVGTPTLHLHFLFKTSRCLMRKIQWTVAPALFLATLDWLCLRWMKLRMRLIFCCFLFQYCFNPYCCKWRRSTQLYVSVKSLSQCLYVHIYFLFSWKWLRATRLHRRLLCDVREPRMAKSGSCSGMWFVLFACLICYNRFPTSVVFVAYPILVRQQITKFAFVLLIYGPREWWIPSLRSAGIG